MPLFHVLFILLAGLDMSLSQDEEPSVPWGCGFGLTRPFTLLCDLDVMWGVVVEAVAASGVLAAVLLALVLLCRLRSVTEAQKRSGIGTILLLLFGIIGLFGLSFGYLIEPDESLCVMRRALWGIFFALCFSCMLAQGVRLRRLARESRAPGGCTLAGLALGLTAVQGIIAAEWLLLTVLREGHPACHYQPLDFTLACSYVLALLLAALISAGLALCGKTRKWRCNAVWLLVSCLMSILLWVAWVGFYVYGNQALGKSPDWDEPALAVALVAQGWLLLLCHAAPEAHACLQAPPQPLVPDYFDTSQNSSRMREASLEEDIPLSHRQFVDNQGYAFDENTAGLRSGSHHNGNTGARPSAPFRSNVYQPTEMTMILNGGASRHRPFLRFAFEGQAYQYKVLPFVLALSPRTFTKITEAALTPLREQGVRVLNYLDDWLILAHSRELLCISARLTNMRAQPHMASSAGVIPLGLMHMRPLQHWLQSSVCPSHIHRTTTLVEKQR